MRKSYNVVVRMCRRVLTNTHTTLGVGTVTRGPRHTYRVAHAALAHSSYTSRKRSRVCDRKPRLTGGLRPESVTPPVAATELEIINNCAKLGA